MPTPVLEGVVITSGSPPWDSGKEIFRNHGTTSIESSTTGLESTWDKNFELFSRNEGTYRIGEAGGGPSIVTPDLSHYRWGARE